MKVFSDKELLERRNKVFNKLNDFSIAVLFSGVAKKCSADEDYNFVVNKNFYYLTQIDQEDSMLILYKTPTQKETFLFVQPYDESKEKWTGKRLTIQEAKTLSAVDNVLINESFNPKLDLLIGELKELNENHCSFYLDLDDELKIASRTTTKEFKENLANRYDFLSIYNIYDLIIEDRMIKSHEEIQCLRKAIDVTKAGIYALMNNIKPNMYEYELSSLFEYTILSKFNCKTSFNTIAASGKNATILHYPKPIDTLVEGDLMLFDLGAQYNYYCGDISRVLPINGTFNELQLKLYNEVLKCNELVIRSITPGICISELQEIAKRSLAKSLIDLGIAKSEEELIKYYFHNVSHHLGLDTHDPSFREKPLVPGNVITVEPGLYIKELGIGIRIEDDILVTQNGNINLSSEIVKKAKEIEKLMSTRR